MKKNKPKRSLFRLIITILDVQQSKNLGPGETSASFPLCSLTWKAFLKAESAFDSFNFFTFIWLNPKFPVKISQSKHEGLIRNSSKGTPTQHIFIFCIIISSFSRFLLLRQKQKCSEIYSGTSCTIDPQRRIKFYSFQFFPAHLLLLSAASRKK